ncbi:MAG: AAA family ATPase [Haliea sp.]|nr:AAA family ATPase [Haliea sp.]
MIKRILSKNVLSALAGFPVVYLNGPRQAGKSTLVQALAQSEWPAEYVTFDEATMMGAAEANPESFLRAYPHRLILDEVQMVPGLFRALKLLVDEARFTDKASASGRYLLTGSRTSWRYLALARRAGRQRSIDPPAIGTGNGSGVLASLMNNSFKPHTTARPRLWISSGARPSRNHR